MHSWLEVVLTGFFKTIWQLLRVLRMRPIATSQLQIARQSLAIDTANVASICTKSLAMQCDLLRLPLAQLRLPGKDRVEVRAVRHFASQGHKVCHCEGASVLVMLKAMALPELVELSSMESPDLLEFVGGPLEYALCGVLEADFKQHAQHRARILRTMRRSNPDLVFRHSRIVLQHFHSFGTYPQVSAPFVCDLFAALGANRWTEVADAIFDDPYMYRKGWPDLTVIDAGRPRFVEVKNRDRLHESQVVTIQRMRQVLGDIFEVLQVSA